MKNMFRKIKDKAVAFYEEHPTLVGYTTGVLLTSATTYFLLRIAADAEEQTWDEAELWAKENFGDDAIAVRTRTGRIGAFEPVDTED